MYFGKLGNVTTYGASCHTHNKPVPKHNTQLRQFLCKYTKLRLFIIVQKLNYHVNISIMTNFKQSIVSVSEIKTQRNRKWD